jgi:hypothetical protein
MPIGSRREKSGIYGHCTVECPCCIRFRGFYKPDPACVRLPELEQQGTSQLPKPGNNGIDCCPKYYLLTTKSALIPVRRFNWDNAFDSCY